jgi:biopolymer transport protein ExbB/biopolymer transport protein TolQ
MGENTVVDILLDLSRGGGEWVLYLMLGLSVWATATIIERWWTYRRELPKLTAFSDQSAADLAADTGLGDLVGWLQSTPDRSDDATEARIRQAFGRLRRDLLDRTSLLGTLGANAPFIGLLGTVLGIIEAFAELGTEGGGPDMVMGGIAEALVATGVGLLVAIPCVLAYNRFSSRVGQALEAAEETVRLVAADRRRAG